MRARRSPATGNHQKESLRPTERGAARNMPSIKRRWRKSSAWKGINGMKAHRHIRPIESEPPRPRPDFPSRTPTLETSAQMATVAAPAAIARPEYLASDQRDRHEHAELRLIGRATRTGRPRESAELGGEPQSPDHQRAREKAALAGSQPLTAIRSSTSSPSDGRSNSGKLVYLEDASRPRASNEVYAFTGARR